MSGWSDLYESKTWAQLHREGYHRCCVRFLSGKRCRSRTLDNSPILFCAKHENASKCDELEDWNRSLLEKGVTQ